jgi:hypothetical protein
MKNHPSRLLAITFLAVLLLMLSSSKAQMAPPAPKFLEGRCEGQAIDDGKNKSWRIRGIGSAGIFALGTSSIEIKIKFQKKVGAAPWGTIFETTQFTGVFSGTLPIDTGYLPLTPAPAAGDQYRILLEGKWASGNPPVSNDLPPISSVPVTPVP